MDTPRLRELFWIILHHEPIGISSILEKIVNKVSLPTINRQLAKLKQSNFIVSEGIGPSTKYRVNLNGLLHADISVDDYFKIDVDSRKILERYSPSIFERLNSLHIFTKTEIALLDHLTASYQKKIHHTSVSNYQREFERLMIELSWKSSQIEGNTYDLLDTEQLLKYNIPAPNHTQEEAVMLLNHKAAIEYTRENTDLFNLLTLSSIVDIHTLLTNNLGIAKSIRNRLVRITGTKYTPPDNQFVIEDAVENLCKSVNASENAFEKSIRALLLISYIQPFDDGNKRTARLTANALLMAANKCPLSYRSVTPSEYKKAILLFYEMNNVQAFKKIFIDQYRFAVENYF